MIAIAVSASPSWRPIAGSTDWSAVLPAAIASITQNRSAKVRLLAGIAALGESENGDIIVPS